MDLNLWIFPGEYLKDTLSFVYILYRQIMHNYWTKLFFLLWVKRYQVTLAASQDAL